MKLTRTQLRDIIREELNQLEEAYVPSNIMGFAKDKGYDAVKLVKTAANWAEKAGKKVIGGTAIGKNYDTIVLDISDSNKKIYIYTYEGTIELDGETIGTPQQFKKMLTLEKMKITHTQLREMIKEEIKSLTEDYGDVYTAMASSSSIRLLMKIPGVKRTDIKTQVHYNYGKYPKQEHHAYLAGFHNQELPGGHAQAQKLAHAHIAKMPKIEGVYYYVAL